MVKFYLLRNHILAVILEMVERILRSEGRNRRVSKTASIQKLIQKCFLQSCQIHQAMYPPISSDPSCFWSIICLDDLRFLYLSPSIEKQLAQYNITFSYMQSLSLVNLFDPLDADSIYLDLNSFHHISSQLQACVFRYRRFFIKFKILDGDYFDLIGFILMQMPQYLILKK